MTPEIYPRIIRHKASGLLAYQLAEEEAVWFEWSHRSMSNDDTVAPQLLTPFGMTWEVVSH